MARAFQPAFAAARSRPLATGFWSLLLAAGVGVIVWQVTRPRAVYTAAGFGGYVPAAPAQPPPSQGGGGAGRGGDDRLAQALAAYNAGRYADAEAQAQALLGQRSREDAKAPRGEGKESAPVVRSLHPQPSARSPQPAAGAARATRAKAQWVLAFAAARRRDFTLARERFAALREEAAQLPDGGKPANEESGAVGQREPSLEEEGAYQHAVLTAALGDMKGAEAEYVAFMERYPESPLVQAAVRRIARLHGGDVPKRAEAAWQAAMKTAKERQETRERREAMCGPECLAEFLRRHGELTAKTQRPPGKNGRMDEWKSGRSDGPVRSINSQLSTINPLAREVKTDGLGTTMAALAAAAKRRGLSVKGLQVTWRGLQFQRLPLIALIKPEHYVLVETLAEDRLTVWDPSGGGPHRPAQREYSREEWTNAWDGFVLALESGGER